jgi:hypothetical protein
MKAASILFSALFTAATAQSLGLLFLHWLRPRLTREEQYGYAFVSGAALLSLLVFVTAAAGAVWTATYVILGASVICLCFWRRAYVPWSEHFHPLPLLYKALLVAAMLVWGTLYLLYAVAPEASPDGSAYHLGLVQRYIDQRGFGRITTSMYANLSLGIEMLFLFAFSLGRHPAAATTHFFFLLALPLLIINVARRFGFARAGVTAAILIFLSPLFGIDGSSAYVDVAMVCILVALFGALQTWDQTRDGRLLWLIGIFAGFAYAAKLTAFVAIPYAVGFVLYKLVRSRERVSRAMLIVCGGIGLMVSPWLIKNAVTVGNPFSPFLNRFFPNPYIRIISEQRYIEYQRAQPGLKSLRDLPLEVTTYGEALAGMLGPAFLLAPFGLLALRWGLGRQAVLAGLVFASTYPSNLGTRFLMASAPFAALAIGMAVSQSRAMAPLLILFCALASWPPVLETYAPRAWRIDRFYWLAALRWQPESEYLATRLDGYAAAKLAERLVPKDGRIFMFGGIPQAYCRREIIVQYESAFGNLLGDFIAFGALELHQPARRWNYHFPEQEVRKLRLVQTGTADAPWSISELRLIGPEGEVERGTGWRLRASPNPWEVQLAFDNCPVTRWNASESSRPGMFVEVRLDVPVTVTGVQLEATSDQPEGTARLEVDVDGRWEVLVAKPTIADAPPLANARRLATAELKRYGVTHINVNAGDYFANDIASDPERWGLTLLGETSHNRLYRLN